MTREKKKMLKGGRGYFSYSRDLRRTENSRQKKANGRRWGKFALS